MHVSLNLLHIHLNPLHPILLRIGPQNRICRVREHVILQKG